MDAACEGLPEIRGVEWLPEGGNHDAKHYNRGGTNVVRRICDLRDDCTYVGFALSDIPLAPGVFARMWHPRGGVPYAVSYRAQKGAEATIREWLHDEQWSEEERARIVLLQWGHVHVKGLFWYGNMMLLGPGCFEAQTDYEAERALYPDLGGVVLEVTMTESRALRWEATGEVVSAAGSLVADLRGPGRWWAAVLVLRARPVRGAADPPGGRDGADCSTRGWWDPADPPGCEQGARPVYHIGAVAFLRKMGGAAEQMLPGPLCLSGSSELAN